MHSSSTPPRMTSRWLAFWLPVIGILLLGAAARIINAGHFPVFTDEGWSVWAASEPTLQSVVDKVAADHHPPLFFFALSQWQRIAGDSHLALRMLSIAGGILSVAVVYRIGLDVFDRKTALLAALLFAVLGAAVYYGQEIRHYSWLVLSVSLMTLFFLRYLKRPRTGLLIPYTLSIVAMLYTLYFGLWVLAVQGFISILIWRGTLRQKAELVIAWLAAFILYLPWIIIILQQLNHLMDTGGIGGFPNSYNTDAAGIHSALTVLTDNQTALMVGLAALGIWGLWRRVSSPRRLAGITIALSGVGLLILMFVVNIWLGVASARTLVYLTPMLMLLCGYGLGQIQPPARAVLTGALVIFMLLNPSETQSRLNSDDVVRTLLADYSPGDLIILEAGWDDNALQYELEQALPGELEIIPTLRTPREVVVPLYAHDIVKHQRVWVINWLHAAEVMPFLNAGELDYQRPIYDEIPVSEGYRHFGDPTIRVALYEHPQTEGAPFAYGDAFTLHGAIFTQTVQAGSDWHVDLWWSAKQPQPRDYSGGVFLLDSSGMVRVENDSPLGGDTPTSQWTPGAWMFDRRTLPIPSDLPPGQYMLGITAYWYAQPDPLPVDGNPFAIVGEVEITPP